MGEFLRPGDLIEPKLVYTLPEYLRPEMLMYHSIFVPAEGDSHAVCVVHPNGEVRIFAKSKPADVMAVLAREYNVSYQELEGISWV